MKIFQKLKTSCLISFFAVLCLTNCTKENTDAEIEQDIITYFKTIKSNNLEENKKLFSKSDFPEVGTIQSDFYFIKDNYDKINPDNKLVKNIKVIDSFILSPNIKAKYVIFEIKARKDSQNIVRPLIIEFRFPVPYKSNSMTLNLDNQFEWKKNIPVWESNNY